MKSNSLHILGFQKENGSPISGLVPITESEKRLDQSRVDEIIAVTNAASFKIIDFAFFRRFEDGRSSQLTAYIVDNRDDRHSEEELAKLHLEVWRQGTVPLLYIAWPTRIDILMCGRDADFWQNNGCEYNPAKKLEFAADISDELKRFSAHRLADGTFWEDPGNWSFTDYKKAAHHSIIQAIVEADREIDGERQPVMRRLLLLMVLIKYLEDRGVFAERNWFGDFCPGAESFFAVLREGDPESVYNLLGELEQKFNGDVFELSNASDAGRGRLTKKSLRVFADLVEAKTLGRQRYLWEQHSFAHLPVEIISHLYQHFVPGGQGAVYTPPFLASLLLDSVMPYAKLTGRERVLDPSCGSGVFLVGAFRRLINVWRMNNGWRRPRVNELKRLLRECIFGVEMDATAVDLAAFSLSLAICDVLKPDVIWSQLRFDKLRGNNLIKSDFFDVVLDDSSESRGNLPEQFDVVIGNPPFMNNVTAAGKSIDKRTRKANSQRGELPDKNVAYLFLEQSIRLLSKNGAVCLIQPNGILYNSKTFSFRSQLISECQLDEVHDFISIRNLYGADTKTVALRLTATKPTHDHCVIHRTYRRTASVHQRIGFELDHYDCHLVPQEVAELDPHIWRIDLLGGGRLKHISDRFRELPTLDDFICRQGWEYGEGFIAAKSGKRVEANFLTGLPELNTRALRGDSINGNGIGRVTETHFRSPYTLARYSSPLVLLKKDEPLTVAYWDNGPLAYRDRILGIHAPRDSEPDLRNFFDTFLDRRPLYRFLCLLHGTESLVDKATALRKQDVDMLPYPKHSNELELSFWEEVLRQDVCEYLADFIRLGQESVLLSEAASEIQVHAYADLYVRMLGSIYDNLRAAEPIFLDGLICQPFYFGERPELAWVSKESQEPLERLIYDENKHAMLRTIRVLKLYDQNTILIVKPDRLRYWIGSTAIRDADETLTDLVDQGF